MPKKTNKLINELKKIKPEFFCTDHHQEIVRNLLKAEFTLEEICNQTYGKMIEGFWVPYTEEVLFLENQHEWSWPVIEGQTRDELALRMTRLYINPTDKPKLHELRIYFGGFNDHGKWVQVAATDHFITIPANTI